MVFVNPVRWNSAEDISLEGMLLKNIKIKGGTGILSGSPLRKWKIDAGNRGIDRDKTEDILILIKYRIQRFRYNLLI